jgi:hypothetical protein
MVLADLGRFLVLGGAAVAGVLGELGLPALVVVAFAVVSMSVFFDVAYQASLVRLVKRHQLVRGNRVRSGGRFRRDSGSSRAVPHCGR